MNDPKKLLNLKDLRLSMDTYSPEWAEAIAEKLLDSKGLYTSLEQLLRGDISEATFMAELASMADAKYGDLKDELAEAGQMGDWYSAGGSRS